MIAAVETGEFTKVDSILVARNGRLVLEAYFNGFDRDTPHNTRSAFKSITSALVGIAIDQGLIADVNQPISGFFPERWTYIESDLDRKNRITLANLLTMRSGLKSVPGLEQSQDWYTFALGQPMDSEPGAQFTYDDANSILIGGVISAAAAQPVPAFAGENLFEPLDITEYCWTMTPAGQAVTSSGFYIRPRDMLKLGQLYSNLGVWNGQRIVSERWVADSTRPRVLPSRSSARTFQLATATIGALGCCRTASTRDPTTIWRPVAAVSSCSSFRNSIWSLRSMAATTTAPSANANIRRY